MKHALALIALLIVIACGDAHTGPQPLLITPEPDTPMYAERMAAFLNAPSFGNTVFMGDSQTEICEWSYPEWFTADNVNRGIAGATTADMIRLARDLVIAEQPRTVYLLVGVNDASYAQDVFYAQNITMLIATLRVGIPGVRIKLISHIPNTWRPMEENNELLRNLADMYDGVEYIDVHDSFLLDGKLNSALYIGDGIHPNDAGCVKLFGWAIPEANQ